MERESFSVDPTTREKETVSGYGFRNLFDGSTLFAVGWEGSTVSMETLLSRANSPLLGVEMLDSD